MFRASGGGRSAARRVADLCRHAVSHRARSLSRVGSRSKSFEHRILVTGHVPDDDLAARVQQREFSAYLSATRVRAAARAMQCGVPVVTSTRARCRGRRRRRPHGRAGVRTVCDAMSASGSVTTCANRSSGRGLARANNSAGAEHANLADAYVSSSRRGAQARRHVEQRLDTPPRRAVEPSPWDERCRWGRSRPEARGPSKWFSQRSSSPRT